MASVRHWLYLLLLAGCSHNTGADETAIRQVAELRRQAIIARDPARYRPLISPAYNDRGKNASAKLAELTAALMVQEVADFRASDVTITVTGDQAVLHDRYRLTVVSKGTRYDFQGEETLRLRKEAGGWKISGGL